jgi:Ca2+-binding RTX toxin-like protein
MTRTQLFFTATGAALALATGSASAATVELRQGDRGAEAYYVAASGERNDVLFSAVDDYTLRVADPGATITVGPGCRSIDEHTAECHYPPGADGVPYLVTAHVNAGDMDDVIRSSHERVPGLASPTSLSGPGILGDGGPGSDTLIGSDDIADELDGGGGGSDRLFGHGNTDVLIDGDLTGETDADHLDGGGGATVSYERRTGAVKVNLSDGLPDGEPGEGDTIVGAESVTGGAGADELIGDVRDNTLLGGDGRDRLLGGDGTDTLDGEAGNDSVFGQLGDDYLSGGSGRNELSGSGGDDLFSLAGGSDEVSCSSGADVANGAESADVLARDCESLRYSFGPDDESTVTMRPNPTAAGGGVVRVSIGCPRFDASDGGCGAASGTVLIREARGRRDALGRGVLTERQGRRSASTGRNASVRVPLTARGRRLARRRGGVLATISVRGRNLPTVRWSVRMRAR